MSNESASSTLSSELKSDAASFEWRAWLRSLLSAPIAVDGRERRRAVIGAALGVLFTACISRWVVGSGPASVGPWLVAPLGASAVLVFAAPASPLAQPWAVVGGNTISAMVGVLCSVWIGDPALAGTVAVAAAITLMFLLRCLHPPGGAMALLAVLVHASQGRFACGPAVLNSLLLVAAGVAYNTATGRRYPHRQVPARAAEAPPGARFKSVDLDAALAHYNQVLDVSRDDLEALLQAAELAAYRRRLGEICCADVMSRELITVEFGSSLQEAWQLMRQHRIKALPVIDRSRRIVGIVTLADFMRHAKIDQPDGMMRKLREFILPDGLIESTKPEVVGQIMNRQVRVASQDRNVIDLMPLFTEAGHHHIPIIDDDQRLVGILTQSDFVRALYQSDR